MSRMLSFAAALREAQDQCMARDPAVTIMGLGAPDPKGVFGSTLGLAETYPGRVSDIPLSENAIAGVAIGAALDGMRPVVTHQRMDFALAAIDQIVNQAAKWRFMFGGRSPRVPLVVRIVVGRGWGQGPQHSQSLQSWFAHVPGLKVVMPATARDAKGLLVAAIEDDGPVIFLEHRWLYGISDTVPEDIYRTPLGRARVAREGTDVSIVATSYMALESLRAADRLAEGGISAEVVDVRSLRPLDTDTILASVTKTGRLVTADTSWKAFGAGSEIVALAAERAFASLKAPPRRIALPDYPAPTSPALSDGYYPRAAHIVAAVREMFGRPVDEALFAVPDGQRLDQPDPDFTGPF